ncbi:MAG: Gfo/Idh/MocA family oxidoreductase [Nitrosopumilaceae archaeon]
MKKLRFGIIGCSRIAESSTIPAILNSKFADIQIIGSRSEKKSKKFAEKFKCPNYGSYEDVLENKDVDAVYISVPIGLHEKWAIQAAKHGKHILCEKSSTTSFKSAKKMVSTCKQNNVRLMEALMFRFHPQHKRVQELINNGVLGKLFIFSGSYGFSSVPSNDIRYNRELGGGILNDAACYPICASRIIFAGEPLSVISSLTIDESTQVDVKANLCLKYKNEKFAHMSAGYDLFYQSTYDIWGSEGMLKLGRAYNIPSDMKARLLLDSANQAEEILLEPCNHYLLMIDSFCNEVMKKRNSDFNFEDDLLKQARIMQAARVSNHEKRLVELTEI